MTTAGLIMILALNVIAVVGPREHDEGKGVAVTAAWGAAILTIMLTAWMS
jgi:hypothetical protein